MLIEMEFLLRCLSPDEEVRRKAFAEISGEETEGFWQNVEKLATYHRLLPLLCKQVVLHADASFPNAVRAELKKKLLINAARNLISLRELLYFQKKCAEYGIDTLPFKGPVVSQLSYGDSESRSFVDIDILVSADDVLRLIHIFKQKGYEIYPDFSDRKVEAYIRHEDQLVFMHKEHQVNIDLHWEASARYSIIPFCLGKGADGLQEIELFDEKCKTFSTENSIILHCLHAGAHSWESLEQVVCLAWLLSHAEGVDWTKIRRQAKHLRCWRIILLGFLLCSNFMEIDLPASIKEEIEKDSGVRKYGEAIKHQLLECRSDLVTENISRKFTGLHFFLRDSRRDGLLYLFRLLCRPTIREWEGLSLPAWLSFLYYGYRPLSLLLAGIGLLVRKR